MTDNGRLSLAHAAACRALGLGAHPRAYRPRTNGKAERFIRTLVEGWAYESSGLPGSAACARWSPSAIASDHTAASTARRPTSGYSPSP